MILGLLGNVAAMLAVGWMVLVSYRYVARRSVVAGRVFALAIVVRASFGVALFSISYFQLPVAESLQLGNGFWQPAMDAAGYYLRAAGAADAGRVFDGAPAAPIYVSTLALWMKIVGMSPAAGLFLNLCLYAVLVVSLVWFFDPVNELQRDLPCIVGIAAYSFCPIVLFHSTQPLKEELLTVLLAMACLGMLGIGRLMYTRSGTGQGWGVAAGTFVVAVAIAGSGGVRWYYPLIIWGTLALVVTMFAVLGRTEPLPRYLAGSAAVLFGAWLGVWGGTGTSYRLLAPDFDSLSEFPSRLITLVQTYRTGFLTSGGGTNIVVPLRSDKAVGQERSSELREASHQMSLRMTELNKAQQAPPPPPQPAVGPPLTPPPPVVRPNVDTDLAIPVTAADHLRTLATGLGLLFVPISVMQALLGLEIPGGRGLLSAADVDTLYVDTVTIAVLTLLWRRRPRVGDRLPFVVFGLALAAVTALLLGYVVTNYGTLWRMRPLVTIPLWVVVVALSPRARDERRLPQAAPAVS